MVVAPLFDPSCKVSEAIETEARGPPEMVLNVRHEVDRVLLLNV